MRAEVLADSDAGRPAISAPAQRSAVRYLAGIAALALLYYGAAQVGYALDFAGPGRRDRLAAGRRRRQLPLPRRPALLARRAHRRPARQRLLHAAGRLGARRRRRATSSRCSPRRCSCAGCCAGSAPLGSVRGLGRMLVALAAGTVGQRDDRHGGAAPRRRRRRRADRARLADVVAGRLRGRARRRAAGDRLVPPVAPRRLERRAASRRRSSSLAVAGLTRPRVQHERPAHLRRLPGADLGRAALRPARRDAAVAVAVSLTVYDTAHYDGPFSFESITRSVLSTQLYIAVSALSALCLAAVVSERERFAGRLGASRERLVEAGDTARRRLEHDLHDGAQQRLTALVVRLRGAELDSREDPERAAAMFAQASAEVSLAIDELRQLARGLHPAVLTDFGLASAIRDVAGRSAVPITLVALPEARLRDTVESTAYFVFAEAVTNAQRYAGATVDPHPGRDRRLGPARGRRRRRRRRRGREPGLRPRGPARPRRGDRRRVRRREPARPGHARQSRGSRSRTPRTATRASGAGASPRRGRPRRREPAGQVIATGSIIDPSRRGSRAGARRTGTRGSPPPRSPRGRGPP